MDRPPVRTLTVRRSTAERDLTEPTQSGRAWDIAGLKKELDRLIQRQLKKVGKAEVRRSKATEMGTFEEITEEVLLMEVDAAQKRLEELRDIEAIVAVLKKGKVRE
jgi:CRISPR/Cas system CSM-associated protein Csm2 small subunit